LDLKNLLALFDQYQRISIDIPGMRKDVLPHVVRFVRPAPGMNFILHSSVDESNANEVIQQQIDYFSSIGRTFEWKTYDYDTPPDLKERLAAHGFVPEEPGDVMLLDLQQAPPALLAPVTADVRPITRREQLGDVIRVLEQVWNEDFSWVTQRLGDHLEIPGYLNVSIAYEEGQPACTGWIYFYPNSPFADLWGGSTVAHLRGRGLYTALLATRVQTAIRRDCRYLALDAGPMSRPIVEKHGFQLLTHTQTYEYKVIS
jgi:GNAT superfamily N-acetyltransferase